MHLEGRTLLVGALDRDYRASSGQGGPVCQNGVLVLRTPHRVAYQAVIDYAP